LTEAEIAYAGKKLKPIIFNELVRIAEVDGEPVAFMLTIPDINELTRDLNGELFPFNFIKLLWRLRKPRTRRLRVPLMGVAKKLHHTRMASQLAFMMIEFTRRDAVSKYGASVGEFGWILEDNKGMLSIAQLPGAAVNHRYRIYEKALLSISVGRRPLRTLGSSLKTTECLSRELCSTPMTAPWSMAIGSASNSLGKTLRRWGMSFGRKRRSPSTCRTSWR
jgi:hypothetical protein